MNIWDSSKGRIALKIVGTLVGDRAVPTGCDFTLGGPHLSRGQNAAIPIYFDDTANPSGWGGTYSNILSALNTNNTGIDSTNTGSTAYVPDCGGGRLLVAISLTIAMRTPVELISFEASIQENQQVDLSWITATEMDNAYFSIQRSPNGIQYEEIHQVPG